MSADKKNTDSSNQNTDSNNQNTDSSNQNTDKNVNELRNKLKHTLKRFIPNKDLLEKEIFIFEKTVSRRSFLSGTAKVSAVAALVGQGLVPSAWAARRPEIALPSHELPILTNEMKKMVTSAASILVSSDVVDGMLKHRHIEITGAKEYEDTLEAMNPVCRAQEDLDDPEKDLYNISHKFNRTYGHPELVRLQNSSLSDDSLFVHNGHELVLYEYNTDETAPVKKRTIQLPAAFPEILEIKPTNKTGGLELRRGDEIQNKYFRLIYLPDLGNVEVYSKDTDTWCWTLFNGKDYPTAETLVFQRDGRLALYSSKGEFLKDFSGLKEHVKKNVTLKFTGIGNIELYSDNDCYYSAGEQHFVDKSVFENYKLEDFDYNRVVSINGHQHNTIDNGYVRNQKMILVAKQSVHGSWDGIPSKWLEHTSDMSTCWEQMRLYVQHSRHEVHMPDNGKLKAIFDQGSITDTSGENWHVYNPLAILQKNIDKLIEKGIDPRVFSDYQSKRYGPIETHKLRLTIEDIGKFESGDEFSCLYGTVKINLWLNLGFYIFLQPNEEVPVVKFVSLNNHHRCGFLWFSDCENGNYNKNAELFHDIYKNKDFRFNDPNFSSNNIEIRRGHVLLRQGSNKSFIEQLFRPVGYFNDKKDDNKLLMAYELTHSGDGSSKYLSRGIAMQWVPVSTKQELYIYDIHGEKKSNETEQSYDQSHARYICPREVMTGKIFGNSSYDISLGKALFNDNRGLARPIFEFRKLYETSINTFYKMYFNGGYSETCFNKLYEARVKVNNNYNENDLTPYSDYEIEHGDGKGLGLINPIFPDNSEYYSNRQVLVTHSFEDMTCVFNFSSKKGSQNNLAKDWFSNNNITKVNLSFSLIDAARYVVHTKNGGLYIFKQKVIKTKGYGAPDINPVDKSIIWDPKYQVISSPPEGNETRYSKTLRMLDWTKYSSDQELIVVQESNIRDNVMYNNNKKEIVKDKNTDKAIAKYKYLTKEIADETWHDHVIDAQLASGEEHVTEHIEQATIYDVEIQAQNIYHKPCTLTDDQCYEIRFAQPCYFENFTVSDQRKEGAYAKRMESFFIKPEASGKALLQVKCPTLDRLSGITMYYRIVEGHKFEAAVSKPLLRLKNDANNIHEFGKGINLAYQVHKRMNEQSNDSNSDLMQNIYKNMDSDYQDDNNTNRELKKKLQDGILKTSKKLCDVHFEKVKEPQNLQSGYYNEKTTIYKRRDAEQINILYRDQSNVVLYQGNNEHTRATMLFGSSNRLAPGMLGGWLSDIWGKICDFAISILNKIKEAINWIKDQLEKILEFIEDLEIPGISDIARIAKGVVSLVASVLTAIVDVAIMIVNVLKHLFDFDVAYRIGEKLVSLFRNLHNFIKPGKQSLFQSATLISMAKDIDQMSENMEVMKNENSTQIVEGSKSTGGVLDDIMSELSHIKDLFDNFFMDGINYVLNFVMKYLFGGGDSSDTQCIEWRNKENEKRSKNILKSVEKLTNQSIFPGGALIDSYELYTNLKDIDLSDPIKLLTSELNDVSKFAETLFNDPVGKAIDSLTEMSMPGWIGTISKCILGVELKNFCDITYLVIGYPLMMSSELIPGLINAAKIPGLNITTDFEGLLDDTIKMVTPGNNYGTGSLYAADANEYVPWKKDTLFKFQQTWNIVSVPLSGMFDILKMFQDDNIEIAKKSGKGKDLDMATKAKASFSAITTFVTEFGGLVNEVPSLSRDMNKFLGWFGCEMIDPESAFYKSIYNVFPQQYPNSPDGCELLYYSQQIKIYTGWAVRYLVRCTKLTEFSFYLMDNSGKDPNMTAMKDIAEQIAKIRSYINLISSVVNLILDIIIASTIEDKGKQVNQLRMDLAANIMGDFKGVLDGVNSVMKAPNPLVAAGSITLGIGGMLLSTGRLMTDESS